MQGMQLHLLANIFWANVIRFTTYGQENHTQKYINMVLITV